MARNPCCEPFRLQRTWVKHHPIGPQLPLFRITWLLLDVCLRQLWCNCKQSSGKTYNRKLSQLPTILLPGKNCVRNQDSISYVQKHQFWKIALDIKLHNFEFQLPLMRLILPLRISLHANYIFLVSAVMEQRQSHSIACSCLPAIAIKRDDEAEFNR